MASRMTTAEEIHFERYKSSEKYGQEFDQKFPQISLRYFCLENRKDSNISAKAKNS